MKVKMDKSSFMLGDKYCMWPLQNKQTNKMKLTYKSFIANLYYFSKFILFLSLTFFLFQFLFFLGKNKSIQVLGQNVRVLSAFVRLWYLEEWHFI